VTAPGNYDSGELLINVDPDALFRYASVDIRGSSTSIVAHIYAIVQTWNSLKLGWMGNTADEVQDFNTRWSAGIEKLFGTEDKPEDGILSKVATAAGMAAINYGVAEDIVTKMFTSISNGIDNPASAGPRDSNRDLDDGPITENTH
jgi:hypothetical protein